MKKLVCIAVIQLTTFASVWSMATSERNPLQSCKDSFIQGLISGGTSREAAEHLYIFKMLDFQQSNVEKVQEASMLSVLAQGNIHLAQELAPHINESLRGSGEDSLLSMAVSECNVSLIKNIIDSKLCLFVRKKTAENQENEERFPFLDSILGLGVRTLIKLTERSQKLEFTPSILSYQEMDQWEVVK